MEIAHSGVYFTVFACSDLQNLVSAPVPLGLTINPF